MPASLQLLIFLYPVMLDLQKLIATPLIEVSKASHFYLEDLFEFRCRLEKIMAEINLSYFFLIMLLSVF